MTKSTQIRLKYTLKGINKNFGDFLVESDQKKAINQLILIQNQSQYIENVGLVRFVDNCPWTSTVHGQNNFFLDCPYFMDIVHIL